MIRLLVLLFLLVALRPAFGQVVTISTGEHEGFSRLVITLPQTAEWRVGRTEEGYVFQVNGAQPRYDLSRVFDRIDRRRLASIWADPEDGSLRLGVACTCHALPFEFRSGIVVIDLRDGPAPSGSSFEQTLDGRILPQLAAGQPLRPRPRAVPQTLDYDWRDAALGGRWSGQTLPASRTPPLPDHRLLTITEELAKGFSRAVAEGLVDPVSRLPLKGSQTSRAAPANSNLRLGIPLDAHNGLSTPAPLAAQGEVCPPPESLAVAEWADARPVSVQMAEAMANLTAEFDRPNPVAVKRAARFLLHLGFGAEADDLLAAFPTDDQDRPLWQSMARILEGSAEAQGAFAGLAACDGPAALWAALADPSLAPKLINTAALLRAFSALPPHLRRHLGPSLAERFLAAGDTGTATAMQDALLRLPGPPDPGTTILSARITSAQGSAPEAAQKLDSVLSDSGPSHLQALIALVDLHAAESRPLDPAQVEVLASFLAQAEGTEDAPDLARAYVLSLALTDRFDEAFAALPTALDATGDVWRLLAGGPDSAVLIHSIGGASDGVSQPVRDALAARLYDLGFPEEARRWSPTYSPPAPPAPVIPSDAAIRAPKSSSAGPDARAPWQDLMATLSPVEPDASTPLARGRALAESSADTRAAVAALLSALPKP